MSKSLRDAASSRAMLAALTASCAMASPLAARAQQASAPDQVDTVVVQGAGVAASGPASPATTETVSASQLADTVNLTNTEDALKYFPSLLVRKRHVGDTQAPLATRTSGLGASARSLIYADGVLLSALIGNNNSFASPRWSMVSPNEIARVDVLYGPFSAAYPGNSVGAVVNYTTRMPDRLEAGLTVAGGWQGSSVYGTRGTYPVRQLEGDIGDRFGRFSWRLGANHVESRSQPLTLVTAVRPSAPSGTANTFGAFNDRNRAGAPIVVLGAGGLEDQRQDNLKARVAFDVTPTVSIAYTAGLFLNDTDSTAQTYLRSGTGAPVYAGPVNIGGYPYSLAASAFSNGVYRLNERHWLSALTAGSDSGGVFDWHATLSRYDYNQDQQRIPTTALPTAFAGGAGTITKMDGTGWTTADLSGSWRAGEAQTITMGAHADRYQLVNRRYNTTNWISGAPTTLAAASLGKTQTEAVWLQDAWAMRPQLTLTLGGRYETWKAYSGVNFSLSPTLAATQPRLSATRFSPKATMAWRANERWTATASFGEAYRFPTVSELYQAVATGLTLSVPNPRLRPERAYSEELAILRKNDNGQVRLSLFEEDLKDALVSQSSLLNGSTVSFVQNIDRVRTRGLELSFEQHDVLVRGLELSGSVTVVDPTIRRDAALPAAVGKDTPGVPRNRATLVATYRPDARWAYTLAARYSDRSYATIDNSDPVSHTYQGFEKFLVLDARVNLKLDKGWSLAAGVDNLTNQDYFLFHPFPQRTASLELHFDY